jgi:hypothetical protein
VQTVVIVPKGKRLTFAELVDVVHRGEAKDISYDTPIKVKGSRPSIGTYVVWGLACLPAVLVTVIYILRAIH